MPHTYVTLSVSPDVYAEIRAKFLKVDYGLSVKDKGDGGEIIDMHGIALISDTDPLNEDGGAFHKVDLPPMELNDAQHEIIAEAALKIVEVLLPDAPVSKHRHEQNILADHLQMVVAEIMGAR